MPSRETTIGWCEILYRESVFRGKYPHVYYNKLVLRESGKLYQLSYSLRVEDKDGRKVYHAVDSILFNKREAKKLIKALDHGLRRKDDKWYGLPHKFDFKPLPTQKKKQLKGCMVMSIRTKDAEKETLSMVDIPEEALNKLKYNLKYWMSSK